MYLRVVPDNPDERYKSIWVTRAQRSPNTQYYHRNISEADGRCAAQTRQDGPCYVRQRKIGYRSRAGRQTRSFHDGQYYRQLKRETEARRYGELKGGSSLWHRHHGAHDDEVGGHAR